ncbi:hypothetical protein GGI35DRAFT_484445 [Trichoderma velutinum]
MVATDNTAMPLGVGSEAPNEISSGSDEGALELEGADIDVEDNAAATRAITLTLADITPQDIGFYNALYQINSLQADELDEACDFFGTTAERIRGGLVLPGTSQCLTLPQLALIFRFLKKCLDRPCQPQGQLCSDALGEIHSTMGLIAIWVASAADYFLPDITPRGSQQAEDFIAVVSWRGGRLVIHQLSQSDEECFDAVTTYKSFSPSQLMVGITADVANLSPYTVQQATREPSYTDAVRRLRDENGVTFRADPDEAYKADQSRFIVVISSSVFSQGKALTDVFRVPVNLHHPSRRSTAHVWFPFPNLWLMFIYDGFQKAKGTQLWKRLMDVYKLTCSSIRCTQWCFLGATPILSMPDDIRTICCVLLRNPRQIDAVDERLGNFTTRFVKLQALPRTSKDAKNLEAELGREFSHFMEPIIIVRDQNSPLLEQTVADTFRGYEKVIKTISVPPQLMSDVEALGERYRSAISRAGLHRNWKLEALVQVPEFIQYYCAAIMPGVATAHLYSGGETYPTNPEEIDRDIGSGSDGIIYQSAHLHTAHAWLDVVSTILTDAYYDRGRSGTERSKHVLIVTTTPNLAAHLRIILGGLSKLKETTILHYVSLLSIQLAKTPSAQLKEIGHRALQSHHTHVVISTADIVATSAGTLTFCSYLIIFGELFLPHHKAQIISRIRREGQQFPIHVFHIQSTHKIHELVRNYSQGRQATFNDINCLDDGNTVVEMEECS